MKKNFLFSAFVLVSFFASGQGPSSCVAPVSLMNEYSRDICNMAIRRMHYLNSPDTAVVKIPTQHLIPVKEALAAVFNAGWLTERDTVFNIYCVHDLSASFQTYPYILVQVDTNYPWTSSWQSLTTLTGNAYIDHITSRYHLSVHQFYNWSFGSYALLHTDSLWNVYALCDTLDADPGVINAHPDYQIGTAGKILFNENAGLRTLDFFFEFNDCFDGCDNYRKWSFIIHPDCSVSYTGYYDWGFFGIEPLPAPVNCNLFTGASSSMSNSGFSMYPNPASEGVTVQLPDYCKLPATYIISDLSKRVYHSGVTEDRFFFTETSGLQSGLYLIRICDASGQCSIFRFVKY